ncbi:MAG: DUF5040 domain-containing protein [Dysgonomonas sp.]|nr:DUF5040 domain-containing protein [Dysgonomonas sp.]
MKKLFFIFLIIIPSSIFGGTNDSISNYTILLTGASFASYQNTWFEMGCRKLNAEAINRAVGAEAIANTANKMVNGSLYSFEEFDRIDAFVIMHVHDKDVLDESQLLEKYTDYPTPFDRSNYAAAYDYVIKRYISECYELRNNPNSKYYGTKSGKPVIIILCTHWHDGRETYNASIRKLAKKWGLPLVEFDTYIGFSKNSPHPVTGEQQSRLYSYDAQTTNSIKYGHHPNRGEHEYIQQRMTAIFIDLMKKILPVKY